MITVCTQDRRVPAYSSRTTGVCSRADTRIGEGIKTDTFTDYKPDQNGIWVQGEHNKLPALTGPFLPAISLRKSSLGKSTSCHIILALSLDFSFFPENL
tara:strand:- start:323 stop:619 length:297 start_codon:yes stop_codon:yes gene_type:complete